MLSALYSLATRIIGPLYLKKILKKRVAQGKEDPDRLKERYGLATVDRGKFPVLWVHAASVGESLSVIELIHRLHELYPHVTILMTTQTRTSADLVKKRLSSIIQHQYLPYDIPLWVDNFLDYWKPSYVLWVESELWPNMLKALHRRKIPITLLNGRLSDRSFRRWQTLKLFFKPPLHCFETCLVQSEEQKSRFLALGARDVVALGNIKYASAPLPVVAEDLKILSACLKDRPVWTVASTHPGEEAFILEAHCRLKEIFPHLLTLLVPRHPHRGDELMVLLNAFKIKRRSLGELPTKETEIYLADTLGELGLFYRVAPIAFVGGSWVTIGGHNIIEPAQLGVAVMHGPHMHNFREVLASFKEAQAHVEIGSVDALVEACQNFWLNPDYLRTMQERAQLLAYQHQNVLDLVLCHMKNRLDLTFKETPHA